MTDLDEFKAFFQKWGLEYQEQVADDDDPGHRSAIHVGGTAFCFTSQGKLFGYEEHFMARFFPRTTAPEGESPAEQAITCNAKLSDGCYETSEWGNDGTTGWFIEKGNDFHVCPECLKKFIENHYGVVPWHGEHNKEFGTESP